MKAFRTATWLVIYLWAFASPVHAADSEHVLYLHTSGLEGSATEVLPGKALEFSVQARTGDGAIPTAGRILWYSNLDGFLGDSLLDEDGVGRVDVAFDSPGERVLAVVALDGEGNAGRLHMRVGVEQSTPPRASVSSPATGMVYHPTDPIILSAELSFDEDTTVEMVWSDAQAGPLVSSSADQGSACSGVSTEEPIHCEVALTTGKHVLVLKTWDDRGQISTYVQEVEVAE